MMKMKTNYTIGVHGCDASTEIAYDLTEEELRLAIDIANKITTTSTYSCMPTMTIETTTQPIELLTKRRGNH